MLEINVKTKTKTKKQCKEYVGKRTGCQEETVVFANQQEKNILAVLC